MVRSNPELWRQLAEFEVSPQGGLFGFAKRLARENRWSPEFTRRVFDEYRRFLYLCVVVGQQLTPSQAVGQTWQLHVSYPASYAQTLCRGVLGRPLQPAPPGAAGSKVGLGAGYRATLAAYEQEFGCAPPAEIWPVAERSFAALETSAREPAEPSRRADRTLREHPVAALMRAAGRA